MIHFTKNKTALGHHRQRRMEKAKSLSIFNDILNYLRGSVDGWEFKAMS
jgi:hypothetical protein